MGGFVDSSDNFLKSQLKRVENMCCDPFLEPSQRDGSNERSQHVFVWQNKEIHVPYFFGYKTGFFPFQNNPKDLDPSWKTDLDLWNCLGRVKLVL